MYETSQNWIVLDEPGFENQVGQNQVISDKFDVGNSAHCQSQRWCTRSRSRNKSGHDTVPSSGQLESEEACDRRRTADRPNHKTILEVF
ncbi:hypothetical protein HAX54_047232 [Datura stramonium]|uniref:Uncharacterized protein n=1 Tax=Datura stramonium TaxID=4076 RepID=A0ABS8SSF9_DATST|nr:hypothetical protein [Datura stramonium]